MNTPEQTAVIRSRLRGLLQHAEAMEVCAHILLKKSRRQQHEAIVALSLLTGDQVAPAAPRRVHSHPIAEHPV